MKYMIIEVGADETRRELPLMFSEDLFHQDFAKLISNRIVSAGFVALNTDGEIECFGKSEGLQIFSRPRIDSELIDREMQPFDWEILFRKEVAAGK